MTEQQSIPTKRPRSISEAVEQLYGRPRQSSGIHETIREAELRIQSELSAANGRNFLAHVVVRSS
jgi:hypothetical protein